MRQFKWIEWNLSKIDAHGLSREEVEEAFDQVFSVTERRDGSFQMFAETPSGRRIWVIWRYDLEEDGGPDVLDELEILRFSSSPRIERPFAMTNPQLDSRSPER